MIYNVYISSWERTVPNRERAVPNMPSIYTGWRSDGWQRVAVNEGGSSQVGTDRSQVNTGHFPVLKRDPKSWRLQKKSGLAAGHSQLGAGRSQRRQISFCSVFSHEYIYPCLLHEITNQRNPNLKDNSSINVLLMC